MTSTYKPTLNTFHRKVVQVLPENFAWIRKYFFNCTLQYVADGTGLSKGMISRAEKGKCNNFNSLTAIRAYYLEHYQYCLQFPERYTIVRKFELV